MPFHRVTAAVTEAFHAAETLVDTHGLMAPPEFAM